ncbi:hypothetical protein [Cupriavidus basilensis]|uniref:hypothetical protein n=1 Tax=Cupriavidus basilensis TaxID=68895 RepID=UPI00157B29A8|nr:hypothetical protein [Cupriavidus basilensis]NUA26137.1 hypothetical protein [Cupriavidus basilensis]
MTPLPKYAVDLLIAAKAVASPAVNASPGMLNDALQQLGLAILAFEISMPVIDGLIQEGAGQPQRQPAAINAAQGPSIFDVITGTAGKAGGPIHVRAAGMPLALDDAPTTVEAIGAAARLCDEQAAEWDSDAVVSDKNYAAHCATPIRAMGKRKGTHNEQ